MVAKALEDDWPVAAEMAAAVQVSVADLLVAEGVLLAQLRYAVAPVTAVEVVAVMAPGVFGWRREVAAGRGAGGAYRGGERRRPL